MGHGHTSARGRLLAPIALVLALAAHATPSIAVVPGSWTPRASLNTARSQAGVAVVGNVLYAVGGRDVSGSALTSLESSTIAPDGTLSPWTTSPNPMTTARYGHALVALNGLLYAIGGFASGGTLLGSTEIYDPSTGLWSSGPSLPARGGMGAAVLGGKIYVFGGSPSGGATTAGILVLESGHWNSASVSLSNATAFAMTATVADTAYLAGGEPVTCSPMSAASEIWTTGISGLSVAAVSPMVNATANGAAGAVQGIAYVAGGCPSCSPGSASNGTVFYDPLANSWGFETTMLGARCKTAGASSNEIVYVVGGEAGGPPLTTVESFAPTRFHLNVTASGSGTIVKNPDQLHYVRGQVVELTAVPHGGKEFAGWSGDATGAQNPLILRMMSDRNITVNFQPVNAVDEPPRGAWSLSPAHPNPTSSVTRFEYTVAERTRVRLSVFDIRGREVAVLRDEIMAPGSHEEQWNSAGLAPGLYFVRYEAARRTMMRRVALIP